MDLRAARSARGLVALGLAAAVAALAVGLAAGHWFVSAKHLSAARAARPLAAAPIAAAPTLGFVSFRDQLDGISIAYPRSWTRRGAADPEVALLASGPGGASLSIRVVRLGFSARPAAVSALARRTVAAANAVEPLAAPRGVELGGLAGYRYVYSFRDAATGARPVHLHYFLFRGRALVTLVLQAGSVERFRGLAPIFDQVAATFAYRPQ